MVSSHLKFPFRESSPSHPHADRQHLELFLNRPTVSLGVTFLGASTYGCGDGRIGLTRCAVIDAAPGDRCRQCRACGIPPAAAGSARSALAAASTPVSTADPDGFPRSRTTPPSATTPCGDATPAKCALDTHPCRPRLCLVCSWLQCRRPP